GSRSGSRNPALGQTRARGFHGWQPVWLPPYPLAMKDRRPTIGLALLGAAAIIQETCSTSIDLHKRAVEGEIDGQEIGSRACGSGVADSLGEPLCRQFIALARTQLDREQPGHATIRHVEVYRDPAFAGFVGGPWVVVV